MIQFNKYQLIDLYNNKKLSINQISKYLNCDYWKLFRFFKKEKISTRSHSDATKCFSETFVNPNISTLTKEVLHSEYCVSRLSMPQISDKYGVSVSCIYKKLILYKIPIRNHSDSQFLESQKKYPRLKELTKSKLSDLYITKKLSMPDIGGMYGIDKGIVKRLLLQYDIKPRNKKEAFSTSAYKRKKSDAILRQIQLHGFVATFNPIACRLIDEYGKQNGYNFQHALNGGELYLKDVNYWVDGYDKDKNVVIEYYEKQHKYRKQKDDTRLSEIKNHLQCKFIILHENGKVEIH